MKKLLFLTIVVLMVICYTGCASIVYQATKGKISDELIVETDPNNPFQGTWIDPTQTYLHVIEGMKGTWYVKSVTSYNRNAIYTIEKSGDSYVTSNQWRISVNNNILTVESTTYERYIKK